MTTKIISKLEPKNNGAFPTHEDIYGEGGFQVRTDLTDRDSIPTANRKQGMWVKVLSDGKVYTLTGGISNGDWAEVSFGGGATIFDGGTTTKNVRTDKPSNQSSIDNTKDGLVNLSSDTVGTNGIKGSNYATMTGGDQNYIDGATYGFGADYATICGGESNLVAYTGNFSIIGGGNQNSTYGDYCTVVGGYKNETDGIYGFIGGGQFNFGASDNSVVCGGKSNSANGTSSSLCGGEYNVANGNYSFVGGGTYNSSSYLSCVVGGDSNSASGNYSCVVGGDSNLANGNNSSILGGSHNRAYSSLSSIICGTYNYVDNNASAAVAMGKYAAVYNSGQLAHSCGNSSNSTFSGKSQYTRVVFFAESINGATVNFDEGITSTGYKLTSGKSYAITITMIAQQTGASSVEMHKYDLLVQDSGGTVTVSPVSPPTPTLSIGGSSYVLAYTTSTNLITFTFTGLLGVTVRATATIEATELEF